MRQDILELNIPEEVAPPTPPPNPRHKVSWDSLEWCGGARACFLVPSYMEGYISQELTEDILLQVDRVLLLAHLAEDVLSLLLLVIVTERSLYCVSLRLM